MPKTEKNKIEEINPEASLLGPDSIEKIVDVAHATIKGEKVSFLTDLRKPKLCLPRISKNSVIHITQISMGCKSNCAYCEVKLAKGGLFSYPIYLVIKDVEEGLEKGCKEFWICSQDNACYGFDTGNRLPELLNKITEIKGNFFIRVGMMNPLHTMQILDELIESYKNDKIFKFLHLPIESGSDKVLKIMRRGYEVKDFVHCIKKFRGKIPSLALSTDIIVGHPGEEEKDFKETIKTIKKIKPDVVNLSKFGARPRTASAKMEQIDSKIINERSKILHNLVRKISLENNKKWLNWEGEILIDEIHKNFIEGRNFAYKPIIIKEKNDLGKILNVKIVEAKENFLIGKS
jgi:MiaB-like tRNA modifying enzyme